MTTSVGLSVIDGRSVATLTFSGQFTRGGGNLVDGNYQISIDGSKIRRLGTTEMLDADGDGVSGGMLVLEIRAEDRFFALYGDSNGDRIVNGADRTAPAIDLSSTNGHGRIQRRNGCRR